MYDPYQVLAAIDANKWPILAVCGMAMVCNYIWFIAAVRNGLKHGVYPIPVFCTFFWLAGDASLVFRFEQWFSVYDHWYMKLFWAALVLTVACELVFLGLIIRFGRREIAPMLTQGQFTGVILAGVVFTMVVWEFVKGLIGDELYVTYFHLANLAGPPFMAALMLRRRSAAGTTPLIWFTYAAMEACWFVACALWYGGPFASPSYVTIYVLATLAAVAMGVAVRRTLETGTTVPVAPARAIQPS